MSLTFGYPLNFSNSCEKGSCDSNAVDLLFEID